MPYPPWYGLPSADAVHMAAGLPDGLAQLLDICGPESVDEADAAGWTALHRSAAEGDAQRVQRLLAHGADVAAPTSSGETPLTLARQGGHTACIAEMARAGAANCLTRGGLNALHVAIRCGDAAGVQALLDAALEQGEAAVASLARCPTAVPKETSWEIVRTPPVCLALEGGHTGILRILVEAAPCAAESHSQYTASPLHWAVARRQPDAVRLLLQAAPAVAYVRVPWYSGLLSWAALALPIHMAAQLGERQLQHLRACAACPCSYSLSSGSAVVVWKHAYHPGHAGPCRAVPRCARTPSSLSFPKWCAAHPSVLCHRRRGYYRCSAGGGAGYCH